MIEPSSPSAPRPAAQSPFQRLATLIAGHAPGMPPIDLAVGEPRHPMPGFVGPVIAGAVDGFSRYPAIRGTDAFRAAVARWLDRRFALSGLVDPETAILPLNGSREGLFFAALTAREFATHAAHGGAAPAVLIPNPYYQAYAAGAAAAGAETVAVPARSGSAMPDLNALAPALLARTIAVYVASPSNPEGTVASLPEWGALLALARRHGFLVFADECYSEIYREAGGPPPGALEAARDTGSLDRLVVFNSLSKRSNLPGLRCGFAAGDPRFMAAWTRLRNMAAPQVPTPVQAVGVAALADEAHVADNRRRYDEKYVLAETILGSRFPGLTPPGGFFLWLDVARFGGGEAAALRLWTEAGLRTVPGGYLALADADGTTPFDGRLRLALVDDLATTETALTRLAATLS